MTSEKVNLWIQEPSIEEDCVVCSAVIEPPRGEKLNLWYRVPIRHQADITPSADPFVLGALFLTMKSRCDMRVRGSVSPSLLANLEEFQQIWSCCKPDKYAQIEISADTEEEATPTSDRAIACFSGGVDAIFTVHRHIHHVAKRDRKEIAAGLFVHGFDMPLSATEAFRCASEKNRAILDSVGVELITTATNFRTLGDFWNDAHGAGLASCLHLFKQRFGQGLIGSSGSYRAFTFPWGSTPVGDPLLSSRGFKVFHDGSGFNRNDKVRHIAAWKDATDNMRVCWEGKDYSKNCGVCEKCVRTILNFRALGIEKPGCFEHDVTPDAIARMGGLLPGPVRHLEEVLSLAVANGHGNEEWIRALRICIKRNRGVLRGYYKVRNSIRKHGFQSTVSKILRK